MDTAYLEILSDEAWEPASLPYLGFLVNKVAQEIHARANEALAPLSIQARHYGVLALLEGEGPLRQTQIGERLRIDRTTMVSLIDDLEKLEAAERRRDPADRRAYAVTLTAQGRALLEQGRTVIAGVEGEFLAPLDGDETATLVELLLRLMN